MTPKASNMTFYPSAAAAQRAGFRACKRCRPDASPGSPEWNDRADLVARAMRLIADGVIDRDGVPELARRLGYSVRQLERQVTGELGAGPLAIARAGRAQTARLLIESTDLRLSDVAFAAGFSSVRSFNDTIREVYAATPGELRARGTTGRPDARADSLPGAITVRLPLRLPFTPDNLFGHLVATAVPGVEEWRDGAYRRTIALPGGPAIVALRPRADHIETRLLLSDLRDLAAAIARCRWLLDLDADPVAVDGVLGQDPRLAELVARAPGRRVPRSVDGAETAIRVVLGQQVSTAAARTHTARLVAAHGRPIDDPEGGLTHLFPEPAAIADLDPETDAVGAMPATRRRSIVAVAAALADGPLDLGPGADRGAARIELARLPGVGPWTVEMVAMRALGDPDAFPATDLGVRQGAERVGLDGSARALIGHAEHWSPWRAYAVQYLWATSGHPINRLPSEPSGPAEPISRSGATSSTRTTSSTGTTSSTRTTRRAR